MDAKKKLIVSATTFAFILLATIVGVVSVLAAKNVSATAAVKVSYTADSNVIGSITITATPQSGTQKTATASFDGSETENSTKGFSGDLTGIGLNSDSKYVTFTFSFTNTSTVADYTATLSFTSTKVTNVKFYKDGIAFTPNYSNLGSVTVAKNGGTNSITIKVQVNDQYADATFEGTFNLNLVSANRT